MPVYENHYHCKDCDVSWIDHWSCACDDPCPCCDTPHVPERSDVLNADDR